ncbi:MAG: methionine biosynthesis protein MetW [Elusimicrobia bacterium RIFOXYA2_FULL_50_26]|nr:MAG: methionine biosynthesis protein MetW [Elusimicrobia bacterium RIFOXYA2_FULL_50_26]OGS23191.1 MAG: methionine biosynthesis protein MetW [Elusimicrobia bacterium RIFOXYB2_FULL_50_12]
MIKDNVQLDYKIIAGIIEQGSRVLDLGCGNGELIAYLSSVRNAKVQGIELNEDAIYKCVEKGLSVFHSDIDSGLAGYPDDNFDYVILNQSLQETKKVDYVIKEALRVGKKAIIGFPNFAHYRARFMLFFRGQAPVTTSLPYHWHDTPNLRFLSIKDFRDYCKQSNLKILDSHYLSDTGIIHLFPNIFARNVIFVVTK